MNNLGFFKACMNNEFNATLALVKSLPEDNMNYAPHPVNRSAYQITEHILAHLLDMKMIAEKSICDETLNYDFKGTDDAAQKLEMLWKACSETLENCTEDTWEKEQVELTISGKPFVTLPRFQMMWFFFFDLIHHRGQLSSYVRPMGGKNPAIYGYSADTQ